MTDVLVLGGGLAGATAAAVVRAAGASVTVVRKAYGATALSSGALDWIAPDPDALALDGVAGLRRAVDLALERLFREAPGHPLAIASGDSVDAARHQAREALAVVEELLAGQPAALAPSDGLPGLYATAAGRVRWADRVQASLGAGELARGAAGRIVVADLHALDGWRAGEIAEAIAGAPGVSGVLTAALMLPGAPASIRAQDAARWFDASGAEARMSLPSGERPRCVIFPPVLGFTRTREILEQLAAALGCPCAEALATTPSVPGWRLQASLDDALRSRGVEFVTGVATPAAEGLGVTVDGRTIVPRAVVLATGKFVGGGIVRERELRESVYGLPVTVDGKAVAHAHPLRLTGEELRGPQPLLRCGVVSGARANVFVAGGVLADWAYPDHGCGLVVCAITGMHAAQQALARIGTPVEAAR